MKENLTVDYHITQTKYPIYRVSEWDKYQQYKKTSKRYVRQMPWFKFHARELLQQRRFVMLDADNFKFLVLIMCHASQDDGYLVFEDLIFQFRGILDKEQLKENLDFLVKNDFIQEANTSDFNDSRSFGWHRNNNIESTSDNRRYKGNEIGDVIGDLIYEKS
jgi:hypothetical protein